MTQNQRYILNELKTIQKECMEKGISASQWVEWYAEEYRRKNGYNGYSSVRKGVLIKRKEV